MKWVGYLGTCAVLVSDVETEAAARVHAAALLTRALRRSLPVIADDVTVRAATAADVAAFEESLAQVAAS